MTRISYLLLPSHEELMMMWQDPPVQHEPLLLQSPLLRSLSTMHSLLFFRGYLISRTDLQHLS